MKNIAIVCGGDSGEFEISVGSSAVVAKNLDQKLYRPFIVILRGNDWYHETAEGIRYPIDKNDFSLKINGEHIHFDAVFNAIHGVPGEDGRLMGYLDILKIPYTSCGQSALALTFNKTYCKKVVAAYGVNVADEVLLRRGDQYETQAIIEEIGLPAFVKPNSSGSSVGVTKVKESDDMDKAILHAFENGHEILIEPFIQGIEIGCSVMQTHRGLYVFPLTEIVSKKEFFDYEAKYTPGMADEITPARIPEEDTTAISHIGANLYKKLGLKGFVRFDFIITAEKEIYFLEVNTVPGLSTASILPQQAEVMGMPLSELFGLALENVLHD